MSWECWGGLQGTGGLCLGRDKKAREDPELRGKAEDQRLGQNVSDRKGSPWSSSI